jgi:hypothetical protein
MVAAPPCTDCTGDIHPCEANYLINSIFDLRVTLKLG